MIRQRLNSATLTDLHSDKEHYFLDYTLTQDSETGEDPCFGLVVVEFEPLKQTDIPPYFIGFLFYFDAT